MSIPSSIDAYETEQRILRNRRWCGLVLSVVVGGAALLSILKDVDERLDSGYFARNNTRYVMSELAERVDRLEIQLRAARISGIGEGQADEIGSEDERC